MKLSNYLLKKNILMEADIDTQKIVNILGDIHRIFDRASELKRYSYGNGIGFNNFLEDFDEKIKKHFMSVGLPLEIANEIKTIDSSEDKGLLRLIKITYNASESTSKFLDDLETTLDINITAATKTSKKPGIFPKQRFEFEEETSDLNRLKKEFDKYKMDLKNNFANFIDEIENEDDRRLDEKEEEITQAQERYLKNKKEEQDKERNDLEKSVEINNLAYKLRKIMLFIGLILGAVGLYIYYRMYKSSTFSIDGKNLKTILKDIFKISANSFLSIIAGILIYYSLEGEKVKSLVERYWIIKGRK